MVEKPADYREVIDRRRFMELVGVAGTAALAGCGNGDEPTDGGDNDGNSDESSGTDNGNDDGAGEDVYADVQHVSQTGLSTADVQWNPYNPAGFAQVSHEILFDKFAYYNYERGEFMPLGIQNWELVDETTYRLDIREGLMWSNGEDVTASDVKLQLELGIVIGSAYADYVESVETDGNRTVLLNLTEQTNPDILTFSILPNEWLQVPESVFGEYRNSLTELQNDFAWTDAIASGPFELDEKGGDQLNTTRRENHPDARNINFGNYAFQFMGENQAVYQALQNLDIDSAFTIFTPPRIVEQYPNTVEEVATPSLWGYGLVPNHEGKHTGNRAVRQAIAFAIDREQVVQNAGPRSKEAPDWLVGIGNSSQERVLGDSAGDFETYGKSEQLTDRAAEVLEEAGYSKDGGTWKDDNGNAVSLPVQVPSGWSDWVTAAETCVDHLNRFGFDAELDGRSFSNLLDTVWPQGNFTLASGGWNAGAPTGALSYFSLRHQLIENFRGHSYNYPAANESRGGSNADVSVPEMGDLTGENAMTVNPSDRLSELARTTDESTAGDIVLEQAWVTNVDLPMIPVAEKQEQSWLTSDEWDVPENVGETEQAQVHWPNAWLPRQGMMNYSGD
ncbi:ABC transporter substrate-binding protein [Halorhabdus amylolytica]|uniref:ABC transporter substrate-binding protein n=1 Tax=Halorhabdus amylolytica TaxID=2559573 RepID=UPI001B7D8EF4|nr:ABC transporter substrate-binding protein [Halorhabdus amylolytica]